ncbi:fibronectin type III domain-containing protein [Paenibacillus qinlingensis]|uniref:fibronectin type III domain-containing protein n=1 Tax=Paenibacillus qinlingensis TaxID=1837343 RepID=UPI00156515EC|nr:fibronectin type III domain-containing protein [Paenibacillus qinlingensis]NQX61832.1 fibronectin type III domain-containing protein [Paenibacillus qinlingensis]
MKSDKKVLKGLSLVVFMLFLTLSLSVTANAATDYSGGLLDNKPTTSGAGFATYYSTYGVQTDNNEATTASYSAYGGNVDSAWYVFSQPQSIGSFRVNALNKKVGIYFFDSTGALIQSMTTGLVSDGSLNTIPTVKNVTKVGFRNLETSIIYINEFNVYAAQPVANSPINLEAVPSNSSINLNWTAVTGATSYNVKRATTAGGPYTTIATSVTGATYTDNSVTNGTTYYYVVTAVNAGGESGNSNESSATPTAPVTPPPSGRALLVITLVNGLEKEYDLPMADVNAFINWYNGRADGTGSEVYTFNKTYNLAKFVSRKDYIAFSKIETFEVNEYNPN